MPMNLTRDGQPKRMPFFGRDEVLPRPPIHARGLQPVIAWRVANQELIVGAALARDGNLAFQAILGDPTNRLPEDEAWSMFLELLLASRESLRAGQASRGISCHTLRPSRTQPASTGCRPIRASCSISTAGPDQRRDLQGASGDREVLAVMLGGKGTFVVTGRNSDRRRPAQRLLRQAALRLHPCGRKYSITARALEVALTSAPSDLDRRPTSSGRRRSRPACGARRTSPATSTRS